MITLTHVMGHLTLLSALAAVGANVLFAAYATMSAAWNLMMDR
jgi:hypothetical protein